MLGSSGHKRFVPFVKTERVVLRATVLLLLALSLGAALPAASATIDLEKTEIDGETISFITINGELQFGDEVRFADIAIGLPAGVVLLNSPGGNVHAGIEIGKAVRLKRFGTMVLDAYSCASACALAWLGGTKRFMGANFAIGFHAVTLADDPSRKADSVGNALVGAYLNQIGMAPAAIAYITEAQPQGMRWLSFDDAQNYGIDVLPLGPPADTPAVAAPVAPVQRQDWASYGEWIQILSRIDGIEATNLAAEYRRRFPNTFVFRYDNGWFVAAIGPYAPGQAAPEKDRLVRSRSIPGDSLVNRGSRFLDLVWGGVPERPSIAARSTTEAMALDAAGEFFRTWSGSTVQAIGFLNRTYAPQVSYFGKRIPKADVMKEKSAFVERWPQRTYRVRDGAEVQCTIDPTCVVKGLVDWRTYSKVRNTTSEGTASFALSFVFRGSAFKLVSETSSVLSREIRKGR